MATIIEFVYDKSQNKEGCTKWYAMNNSSGKKIGFTTPPLDVKEANEDILTYHFLLHCFDKLGN